MAQLNFPFWMARLADDPMATITGLQPFAFSSPKRLAAFLTAQNAVHWQLHLVTRYSAVTYLTELQLLGHTRIDLNPDKDGEGGVGLEITDLLENLSES